MCYIHVDCCRVPIDFIHTDAQKKLDLVDQNEP